MTTENTVKGPAPAEADSQGHCALGDGSAYTWAARFNALPEDIRTIGSAMESMTRIQHLRMEKKRIKQRADQSIREIDAHIKNCEKHLNSLSLPNTRDDRTPRP